MEEAAAVRRAAEETLGDVDPPRFRAEVLDRVAPSAVPALIVLATARTGDHDADLADVESRAVGVQLVYDGLRLTRDLSVSPPWFDDEPDGANLAILAADVLVARGAYLLAGTEVSGAAVEVIRSFGRDQSLRAAATDPAAVDRRLERDVFELAALAGTAATGSYDPSVARWATDLVHEFEGELPRAEELLPPDLHVETPHDTEPVGEPPGRLPSLDS